MKIEDLKPAWQSFKVQTALTSASIYDRQNLLELLDSSPKSTSQRVFGAGVMLVLIFFFCQGG